MADPITAPTLITSGIALFTIANPIGSLPVFLQITSGMDARVQRRTGLLVGVAVAVILAIALVAGTWVLQAFGIDITAFKIAGNALVAAIGWAMLLARPTPVSEHDGGSPVVVPLAMPIIAGPGAIALAITFAHGYTSVLDYAFGLVVIVVVGALVSAALFFGPTVQRLLGRSGMDVLTRVFGLLLLAIAVQSIITSLGEAFPGWTAGS
ncbi:MAG TPA: MarC family protein [Microbacterium sp.]|nr:MarC family protein [Microbacterium sp.]